MGIRGLGVLSLHQVLRTAPHICFFGESGVGGDCLFLQSWEPHPVRSWDPVRSGGRGWISFCICLSILGGCALPSSWAESDDQTQWLLPVLAGSFHFIHPNDWNNSQRLLSAHRTQGVCQALCRYCLIRNSLVVQWLGLRASNTGGTGSTPGRGTPRSPMP